MPEFNFYGTWVDTVSILSRVITVFNCKFLVDKWYDEPIPLIIQELTEENLSIIKENHSLFLWFDKYSSITPTFDHPNSSGQTRINSIKSNPSIELIIPFYFEQHGKMGLRPGTLLYQMKYLNPINKESCKPSDDLKRHYQLIRKEIIKCLEKRYFQTEIFLVSKERWESKIETLYIGKSALDGLQKNICVLYKGNIPLDYGIDLMDNKAIIIKDR